VLAQCYMELICHIIKKAIKILPNIAKPNWSINASRKGELRLNTLKNT
jgi:hypothetical protein